MRYGVRIGFVQGKAVFLNKELSGRDKRKIRELLGDDKIEFGTIGQQIRSNN